MSGELRSAGMTDDQKMAERGQNGRSVPTTGTGEREITIDGLTAKNANFFSDASYFDQRHNRQGPPELPESLKQATPSSGKTKLVLKNCDFGGKPVIGATRAIFDNSTSGESSGRDGQ